MEALKFESPAEAFLDIVPEELSAALAPLRAGERLRLLYDQLGDRLVASILRSGVVLKLPVSLGVQCILDLA